MSRKDLFANKQVFSSKYELTVAGLLKFEVKSLLGRLFLRKKPSYERSLLRLLHLGCGENLFEGWVNADFFAGFRPGDKRPRPEWSLDLRYPLPCPDQAWTGIFMEHVLEHLTPFQAFRLLQEGRRVLRPGSWIRISVPDLKKYVRFYRSPLALKKREADFRPWRLGAEAIWNLTQNFGHRSVWDAALLIRTLRQAGFRNPRRAGFQQGIDPRIIKDAPHRRWESLHVEAQAKPRVRALR